MCTDDEGQRSYRGGNAQLVLNSCIVLNEASPDVIILIIIHLD